MALRFIDGFDHYDDFSQAYIGAGKWAGIGSQTPIVEAGNGRFGSKGLRLNDSRRACHKILDSQATWVFGMGANFLSWSNGNPVPLIRCYDGATMHCELRINSLGQLLVTRNRTTTLATWAGPVTTNVYHYLEFKVTIDDTVGAAEVRLDGTSVINISGVDTRNGANASADRWIISGESEVDGATVAWYIDDFYACDGSGSSPSNTFLGDVRVETLYPNGNGNSSQFVGSDADSVNNYLLVDDPGTIDGDITYVEDGTVGHKDTYAMSNLVTASGTVFGVQPVPYAIKTDAGIRKICSVARLSTTEVDSADKTLTATYQMFPDIRETKPGGGAWTITDVNNAEFGVKVTA